MLKWQLGPSLRRSTAARMGRKTAFKLSLDNRNSIRRQIEFAHKYFPNDTEQLKVLPISSTDWTSEYRTSGNSRIIIIDFEQINAVNFLFLQRIRLEAPIFHFVEFNIRASELLLGQNRTKAAIRLSQVTISHLRKYAEHHGNNTTFPRPFSVEGLEASLPIIKHVIPSFIFGHEFGHHIYGDNHERIISAIRDSYERTEKTRSSDDEPNIWFSHHFGLDMEYTIYKDKLHTTATRQSRYIKIFNQLKEQIIEESFSDLIGLYACIEQCINFKITLGELIMSLFSIFEGIEQLRLLRHFTEDLSVSRERKLVTLKHSKTPARIAILTDMMYRIAIGEVSAPKEFREYLSPLENTPFEADRIINGLSRSSLTLERALLESLKETKSSTLKKFDWLRKEIESIKKQSGQFILNNIYDQTLRAWNVPSYIVNQREMIKWKPKENNPKNFEMSHQIGFGNSCKIISYCLISPMETNNKYGITQENLELNNTEHNLAMARVSRIISRAQTLPDAEEDKLFKAHPSRKYKSRKIKKRK
ncbi:hypothetical protein P8T57_16845 [Thalassospira sp. SN3W]|uniref:hypothetical protein n=1 Tax=Thalassospira sp. SN3W TaxID=3035476 RepID=UPI00311B348A